MAQYVPLVNQDNINDRPSHLLLDDTDGDEFEKDVSEGESTF